MASLNLMTSFQRVISEIESYKFSKEEQKWVDEYFGPHLTSKQIYGMHCRFHLHLKPDEIGEGFDIVKPNNRKGFKRALPKSLSPLIDEPLINDKADLKKKWHLFAKVLWWSKYVRHKELDESIWDLGEKLLDLYPNGRKSILINVKESIKHRTVIENKTN